MNSHFHNYLAVFSQEFEIFVVISKRFLPFRLYSDLFQYSPFLYASFLTNLVSWFQIIESNSTLIRLSRENMDDNNYSDSESSEDNFDTRAIDSIDNDVWKFTSVFITHSS